MFSGFAEYFESTRLTATNKSHHSKTLSPFSMFLGRGFSIDIKEEKSLRLSFDDFVTVYGLRNCKFLRTRLFSSIEKCSPTKYSKTSITSTEVTTQISFSFQLMHEITKESSLVEYE